MMSKTSSNKIRSIVIAAVLMASVFALSTSFKLAAAQMCGDTITQSTELTADIGPCSVDGIIIGADNITLDCNGHTITGPGPAIFVFGILLSGRTGVTVENCQVAGYPNAFFLESSSYNKLEHNTANNNVDDFALVSSSNYNKLESNTASNSVNGFAFVLVSSSYNKLEHNTANDNTVGITVELGSNNNKLESNTASNNLGGGFTVQFGSNNNKLESNTASNNAYGFALGFGPSSNNNKLESNTASNNLGDGFILLPGSSNELQDNKADGNAGFGYHDTSTGTGTAGTANTYEDNECSSNTAGGSSPTGLCSPQA